MKVISRFCDICGKEIQINKYNVLSIGRKGGAVCLPIESVSEFSQNINDYHEWELCNKCCANIERTIYKIKKERITND